MTAPKEVLDLVERFDRGRDTFRSPGYNETQLRREFLDSFFAALGWDVDDRTGWARACKEVIHEDAIKLREGMIRELKDPRETAEYPSAAPEDGNMEVFLSA